MKIFDQHEHGDLVQMLQQGEAAAKELRRRVDEGELSQDEIARLSDPVRGVCGATGHLLSSVMNGGGELDKMGYGCTGEVPTAWYDCSPD